MHKSSRFPLSPIALCGSIVGVFAVAYIGLIAVVMSYATLTVQFSQSVKEDEAVVAALESTYLAAVAELTNTDYVAAGYTRPVIEVFVPAASVTALR